jgi:hypothetical protein
MLEIRTRVRERLSGQTHFESPDRVTAAAIKDALRNIGFRTKDETKLVESILTVVEGIQETLQVYEQRGLQLKKPGIVLTKGKKEHLAYVTDSDIYLSLNRIEELRAHKLDDQLSTQIGKDKNTRITATIRELLRQIGNEEAHHTIYIQYKGQPTPVPGTTAADYHAQDTEYRALLHKIRQAKKRGADYDTVQDLYDLRLDALKIRKILIGKKVGST